MEKKALEVFDALDTIDVASLHSIEEKKEFYDAIVDCFFVLLYVRVPQGRRAAPLSLTYAQAEQLLEGILVYQTHYWLQTVLICLLSRCHLQHCLEDRTQLRIPACCR